MEWAHYGVDRSMRMGLEEWFGQKNCRVDEQSDVA